MRKCILGWVTDLQSLVCIRDISEKISKNQVGGVLKGLYYPSPPIWISVKDKNSVACKLNQFSFTKENFGEVRDLHFCLQELRVGRLPLQLTFQL